MSTVQSLYANEIVLILKAWASASFAAALFFAFLYGTVRPRLKRAFRIARRNHDALRAARLRVRALENTCTEFEVELVRIDRIRQRTEEHYVGMRRRWEDLNSERRAAVTAEHPKFPPTA